MASKSRILAVSVACLLVTLSLASSGCHTCRPPCDAIDPTVPHETQKMSLPPYTVEPPDILVIDVLRAIPLPPYKVEPLDVLLISVASRAILPNEPITGQFGVETDGRINLGANYGSVYVKGMTLDEVRTAVFEQLKKAGFGDVKQTDVNASLSVARATQQVRGEHLVRPDGTIGLGIYGSVYVVGMTLDEIKQAVEAQLSQFLLEPQVSVDVFAYNSKVYFVVTDGGGYGEGVQRFPITGNETVLSAVSQIYGLPAVASKHRIWLARPDPETGCYHTLPVDWKAIVRCGDPRTNWQLWPDDRIYIQAEPIITFDTYLARIISPIERVLGVTLLGSTTVHDIAQPLRAASVTATVAP